MARVNRRDGESVYDYSEYECKLRYAVVEKYTQIYDNGWTDAYAELTEEHKFSEYQATQVLLEILTSSYQHFRLMGMQRVDGTQNMQTAFTSESKILNDCIQRLLPKKGETTQTQRYISDVKDLCRLLTNSDPPFSISWDFNKGGHFDTNLFDEYMQCGNKIHFVVWPVLYTCEGGDVLCKGVAEAVHDVQKDEDKKAAFANIDDYTSHQVLSSAQNSTDPQQKALSPGGFINAGLSDEPGYVDLKDENRPTKMPERYNQLYDNDWTDAFCELTNNQGLMEQHAIHILLEILMISFQYCSEMAKQQIDEAEKILHTFNISSDSEEGQGILRYMKVQRKQKYKQNISKIKHDINSKVKHTLFTISAGEGLQQYISSVADLCWLLNVQDPPCFIKCGLHRGDKFNDDEYKRYMSSGEEVNYIVWPAMYLFKGGPIISKGVVQAMSTDENAIQDTMETANVISQLHAENKSSKVMKTHLHDNPRSEDNLDSGVPGLDSGRDTMTSNDDESTAIKVDKKLLAIEAQILSSCVSSEPEPKRFPTMPIIAIARCKKKAFKR